MKHLYTLISILSFSIFFLSIEGKAQSSFEICGNGIDDDNNGLIDCNDPAAACEFLGYDCSMETDCGNGVDDDGDGFIDYYDGDCLDDPNNPNDYITIKPDCEAQPVGNQFDIEVSWQSGNRTAAAFGMPMVADVDNDGTPEVITFNSVENDIYILNGTDGSIERSASGDLTNGSLFSYPAVGDVDGDDFGEIFVSDVNGYIKAFNHDLTNLWKKRSSYTMHGRQLNLADFDGDGNVELYQVNEIRDAATGDVIIAGSHGTSKYPSANNWERELNTAPVAVDILPSNFVGCNDCDGLELVVGHIVYSVDIAGKKLTERLNMNNATTKPSDYHSNGYFPKSAGWAGQSWSSTSIVDFNQDGFLDVIIGGTTKNYSSGPTTIFFWDIQNSAVRSFTVARDANGIHGGIKGNFRDLNGGTCNNGEQCTWRRGVGTLNIANIDADPELEITFMSGSSLYALDQDMNLEWANHDDFWESSSGFTGTAVFDFDGDGQSEIVYRDEIDLYIVDGTTGQPANNFLSGVFCSSQTQGDYPIVADVDGDGETEIIVSCGKVENDFQDASTNTSGSISQGHIKVYKAANNNYWVPARQVWNQFTYFNINVNDDLSIPRVQQAHHLNFAQICNDPSAPASFSLNKFLNQSPRISYCGQLTFPSPKLDFDSAGGVFITPPVCPDNQFEVRLAFQNNGDADITKPVPISFYGDDPTSSYSNTDESPYLETIDIDVPGGIKVGQKVDTTIVVNALRGAFTLYVSLNDIGQNDSTGAPMTNENFYPLTKLNGTIRECDDTPTIVSETVNPLPFAVKAVKIRDNRNCPGAIAANTGEIEVLAPDDTPFPSSSYAFTWTNLATGDVIANTALVTGLDSGTYQIVVENTDYGCFGTADTVTVLRFEEWPDTQTITLEELQAVSSCDPGTADGIARVLINGAVVDESQYEIEWEDEQQAGVLAVGDTATNLRPILYKVTVTNKLTGCSDSETIDMTMDLPDLDPNPTVNDNTNCKNPNGNVTAQLSSGNIANYDFMLIQLSPSEDTLYSANPTFNGLAEGIYELRAYDPTTNCGRYSNGVEVEIDDVSDIDDLTLEVVQDQISCEAPYTGQLRANIANASDYDFVWYRGTITSGPGAVIVGNAALTPDTLSTTDTDIYTVVVSHTSTGCTTSEQIQLPESAVLPIADVANFTISHQTTCLPNASIQAVVANPQAGASYVYYLYQGSTELANNTTGLFENLGVGPYVVEIENTTTSCISNPSSTIQITDQIAPFGDLTIDKTPVTNCDPANPDGRLEIDMANGSSNFEFKWFIGVDTSTAYSPQPSTQYELTNIPADDYVVKIFNPATGCDSLVYTSLTDVSADYQDRITATVTRDQEFCHPSTFSGEIEASLIQSTAGGPPSISDYTFYWYEGRKNDVRNGSATLITGENNATISGLNTGWYSVRAVKNDGSTCHALDTAEVRVDDARDFPITNIDLTIVNQSSCDSNDPNGAIEGSVGGNTTDYTFTWYQLIGGVLTDITVNNSGATFTSNGVVDIGVGEYYLEVENKLTGCTGDTTIYLQDNIIKGNEIKLNLSSVNATLCTPPNGEAFVSSIDLSEDDGATFTQTDDPGNYDYQWYYGEDTSLPIDVATNPTATSSRLTGVEPGMYTVEARNRNSECLSIAYTVEVKSEIQEQLDFDFVETTQSDCINPDGGLKVTNITGGVGPFSYQWYKGGDDSYPLTGEVTDSLKNIRSDKYMIRITDAATGCFKDSVYVLPPDQGITPVPPATLSTVDHVTTCNPAAYNGRLVAEVDPAVLALPNFSSHTPDDFFYYWFKGENPQYHVPNASPIDDISNFDIITAAPSKANNQDEISGLEPGFYTVIVVDARDYNLTNGTAALGCRSDPRTFEVRSIATSPEAVFTTKADTYCVNGDGEVTITVGKRSTDNTTFGGYEIVDATMNSVSFFPFPATVSETVIDDAGLEQTTIQLENLESATYTFQLFDETTECDTIITVDIADNSISPNITATNIQLINKTVCSPDNGEAQIIADASTDITDVTDYEFYWHNTVQSTSADIINNAIHNGSSVSGLNAGTYFVYAIDNTTGCISVHQSFEIKDETPQTQISITSNVPDRNCDPVTGDGVITLSVYDEDDDGNVTYPTAYTITWEDESGTDITGQSTSSGTAGGTQPETNTLSGLSAGVYIATILNNDTQCTKIIRDTITYEPEAPDFTAQSAEVIPNSSCYGNGSITITEIEEKGTVYIPSDPEFSNFSFEWRYSDDLTQIVDASSNAITTNTVSGLNPGTYYVYVTNTATNCSENRLQLVVDDESTETLIFKKEIIDFISCTGDNEGEIEVFGGEFDPANTPALGYRYEWSMPDGSAMPTFTVYNADSSRISNLVNGTYKVVMTNKSTLCKDSAEFTINERVYKPVLSLTKLSDQTNCYGNGAAEVSAVTLRGDVLDLSDFEYRWFESDLTTQITDPTYGLDANSITADSLVAGTYYVQAFNPTTGCETLPVQVTIEDESQPLIVVLDDISDPILACDPSNFPEGEIEIEVRNSTDIITSWYRGNSIVDPADSIIGFNNSLEIDQLVPGAYTVWVEDTLTGCNTTRTYNIEGIEVPIVVSTSTVNLSSCIQPNGMIAANINGGSGEYLINWYSGTGSNMQPISSATNNTLIEGLADGTYTLVVQDEREPYCQAVHTEVVIEDRRGDEIMLEINNDFQMTNCDDSVPNGQLSVAVEGQLSRYNFFWYDGTDTSGQPIADGPVIAELTPGQYTVLARDKVTGCISRSFTGEVIAIPDTTTLPAPVVSTTPITRCDAPNGSATAVLDSTMIDPNVDYEYTWINSEGEVAFRSSRSNTANFLAAGDYTVYATNVLTGCSSETASLTIGENIYTPEFEIVSTPSYCTESNGTIRVDFVEAIKIVDIEWLTPDGYASGFNLINQPAGFYEVTITDDQGCKHTKTAELKSEIHVYNGVSPNGDGKNDKFIVSCIGQYERNIVKIYNRAGAIVYEEHDYDNDEVFFEGKGNRGLYIGGAELPEGTYFYIIDKQNGEEPVSGYLELLR
ncbi:gliding motility-associated C-terminal domain-containing protein [Porifericola rhodea]|uniref:T9SS type B sorting domain-containing protein n=1 Tax=Porifericola rhodea TaxID=930972 RepID=UPI0026650BD9|nr:gliding motility-associated C-terminal domain-containing protein [Porifericola rhodea]WKN31205.1 gliding motility-associated C-terminal domain-containing protein [Porifericola rhodea]